MRKGLCEDGGRDLWCGRKPRKPATTRSWKRHGVDLAFEPLKGVWPWLETSGFQNGKGINIHYRKPTSLWRSLRWPWKLTCLLWNHPRWHLLLSRAGLRGLKKSRNSAKSKYLRIFFWSLREVISNPKKSCYLVHTWSNETSLVWERGRRKSTGGRNRASWVLVLALLLTGYLTLEKSFKCSESRFPYLWNSCPTFFAELSRQLYYSRCSEIVKCYAVQCKMLNNSLSTI